MAFQEHSRVWERSPPPDAPAPDPWGQPQQWRPLATWWLLGTIVAVFVLQQIVAAYDATHAAVLWPTRNGSHLVGWHDFLFVIGTDWPWRPWTLVTSTLSHATANHILGNGIFLFFLGPAVERLIGRTRYVVLFFVGGAVAGVVQVHAVSWMDAHTLWDPRSGALGASGALMMIMGILVMLTPQAKILFWFVPMPMWVAGVVYAVLDVAGILNPASTIGNFAHLSGMALGLAYGWWAKGDLRRRGLRIVNG